MRNKIKQLLKKEGGFTLIELLAVVAILAVIVAISIPLIGNVVADSKEKTTKAQEELVIDAAQLYFVQKEDKNDVTIKTLKEEKYLEKSYDATADETTITKVEAENGKLGTN